MVMECSKVFNQCLQISIGLIVNQVPV